VFGYELTQYEDLFEETVDLFVRLLCEQPVTWSGRTRAGLRDHQVHLHTASGSLTSWIRVGNSPESVVRAARYGLPLMITIIGGESALFAPLV
jgi:alkanesulfonate monooxygenase SsuD/methylene tetrahydromethanopterin reductase-like flavin-dependent oxidoreductase (luciferase family)